MSAPLCHMVCNNCGHVDTGPERGTYECEKCGHGDGWGYSTDDKASAEAKSAEIIARGRFHS